MKKGSSGRTISPVYFETLYAGNADPWNYAGSPYEAEKYAASVAALPQQRYDAALELGCSVGVFTGLLARRCSGSVLAVDVSEHALEAARARCAGLRSVRFERCDLTSNFPSGTFDLVSFCELGFYFGPVDLRRIRDAIASALRPGGDLLLVHWTPLVDGHAQTADEVHDTFLDDVRFAGIAHARHETYRLDVLRHVCE